MNIKPKRPPKSWAEIQEQTKLFLEGQGDVHRERIHPRSNKWKVLARKETLVDHEISLKEKEQKLKSLKRPQSEPDKVYVIGQLSGPVKIGISCDVEDRRASIQTGYPYTLRIFLEIDALDTKTARAIEKQCHQGLAAKRLNGEWFEVGSHEAVEYVRRVADGFGVKGFG